MDPRDRKKTPEELAAIAAEIKKQKQKAIDDDAIRNVKNGRIIIFVMAGLMVLSAVVEYFQLNEMIEVFYIYAPIVVCYIILGIVYYRNPFVISIVALAIYGALMLIAAAGDASNLAKGIIIKIVIMSGLIRAIKYGKDYQVAIKNKNADLLDADL